MEIKYIKSTDFCSDLPNKYPLDSKKFGVYQIRDITIIPVNKVKETLVYNKLSGHSWKNKEILGFSHYEVTGGYAVGTSCKFKSLNKAINDAETIQSMTKTITGYDVDIIIVTEKEENYEYV